MFTKIKEVPKCFARFGEEVPALGIQYFEEFLYMMRISGLSGRERRRDFFSLWSAHPFPCSPFSLPFSRVLSFLFFGSRRPFWMVYLPSSPWWRSAVLALGFTSHVGFCHPSSLLEGAFDSHSWGSWSKSLSFSSPGEITQVKSRMQSELWKFQNFDTETAKSCDRKHWLRH